MQESKIKSSNKDFKKCWNVDTIVSVFFSPTRKEKNVWWDVEKKKNIFGKEKIVKRWKDTYGRLDYFANGEDEDALSYGNCKAFIKEDGDNRELWYYAYVIVQFCNDRERRYTFDTDEQAMEKYNEIVSKINNPLID